MRDGLRLRSNDVWVLLTSMYSEGNMLLLEKIGFILGGLLTF